MEKKSWFAVVDFVKISWEGVSGDETPGSWKPQIQLYSFPSRIFQLLFIVRDEGKGQQRRRRRQKPLLRQFLIFSLRPREAEITSFRIRALACQIGVFTPSGISFPSRCGLYHDALCLLFSTTPCKPSSPGPQSFGPLSSKLGWCCSAAGNRHPLPPSFC